MFLCRQPGFSLLIVPWPGRHDDQEGQRCAAKANVERLDDVLRDVADEEGDDAGDGEQQVLEELGEALALEVLRVVVLVRDGGR